MVSIENFYYVLFKHLIRPLNLREVAHRTFGSIDPDDILWISRYGKDDNRFGRALLDTHACYFFDQEPIQNFIFSDFFHWTSAKYFRVFANSEISDLKKNLCREYKVQDWYYFFHGFAALDWYHDAKYFNQNIDWDRPYISLNRLHVNDRSYRLNLVARLIAADIINQGHVSLHLEITDYNNWKDELNDPNTKLDQSARELILKHIKKPLIVDEGKITSSASADFGCNEFELWKSGFWHIVTETVFYYNKLHLTEKIFKPIVAQRPFMLAAAPGNLAYLKSYGFETFDRWIDESYDNIKDNNQRLQAIVDQTQRLCSLSRDELQNMHQEMMPVLEHNFNHFYGDFKKRIVNELVDNFETAVRIWNNGRVDGRDLPLHKIDLPGVKNLLIR